MLLHIMVGIIVLRIVSTESLLIIALAIPHPNPSQSQEGVDAVALELQQRLRRLGELPQTLASAAR